MRAYKKTIYILLFIMIICVAGIFFINYRINIGSVFPLTERSTTNVLGIIENLMYGIFTGAFISLVISIVGYLNEKQNLYIEIYQALNTIYTNFLILSNTIHNSSRNINIPIEHDIHYFSGIKIKLQLLYENRNILSNAYDKMEYGIDNILNVPLLKKLIISKEYAVVIHAGSIKMDIVKYINLAEDFNAFYTDYIAELKARNDNMKKRLADEMIKARNDSEQEIFYILAKINFYMEKLTKIHKVDYRWTQSKATILTPQLTHYYKEILKAEEDFKRMSK